MSAFKNKVVLITGGSSGIGLALARAFAQAGAHVVITGRQVGKLEEAVQLLAAEGYAVVPVVADVTQKAECELMVSAALARFGKLDILVNNAGISMRALFAQLDLEVLHRLMNTNFWGAVYATKAALPQIRANKGSIVNVSSVAGLRPIPGRTGYSASKAALQAFMDSLRTEYYHEKLHILTVYPGYVESNIRKAALGHDGTAQGDTPLDEKNLMKADDVAAAILKATVSRKRDLIIGTQGRLSVWLNKFVPGFMDGVVWRFLQREGPIT